MSTGAGLGRGIEGCVVRVPCEGCVWALGGGLGCHCRCVGGRWDGLSGRDVNMSTGELTRTLLLCCAVLC